MPLCFVLTAIMNTYSTSLKAIQPSPHGTRQWLLPENYTFMYATADTSDEWCNKMIKQCDKTASQRLKEIVSAPKMTKKPSGGNAPIGFISLSSEQLFK